MGASRCCSAWAPRGGGFSCCGAQALERTTSVVVAQGLSCGTQGWLLLSLWIFPDQRPNLRPLHWQVSDSLPEDHQRSPALCALNYAWTACVCVCILRLPGRVLADPIPDLWPLLLWVQMESRCCDFRTEGTNYSFVLLFFPLLLLLLQGDSLLISYVIILLIAKHKLMAGSSLISPFNKSPFPPLFIFILLYLASDG